MPEIFREAALKDQDPRFLRNRHMEGVRKSASMERGMLRKAPVFRRGPLFAGSAENAPGNPFRQKRGKTFFKGKDWYVR